MRQGYRHGTQERTLTTSSVRLLFRAQRAASLLQPFSLERVTPSAASRLVPLADGYGLDWCVTTFESWTSEKPQGRGEPDTAWFTSLPNVCRALCDGESAHGLELARWIVAKQWARVVARLRGLHEQPNPKVALEEVSRMSKPILGLIESSQIQNNPELHTEMTRLLTSLETDSRGLSPSCGRRTRRARARRCPAWVWRRCTRIALRRSRLDWGCARVEA